VPDEPHFPAPGEKIVDPYREPEKPAPSPPSHKIVTRAQPPPSSSQPKHVALTAEEKKALIMVTAAQRPAWKKSLWRSPVLIVTSIVSQLLHMVIGSYAYPLDAVLFIAAIAWMARPLMRKDGFS
jgi:hypothetical protein